MWHVHRRRELVLSVAAVLMVAGCAESDGDALAASDQIFAGLPTAVVQEVLDSQVAQERSAGDSPEAAANLKQSMVRNFISCRSALAAYQEWVSSGVAPEFPSQPVPTYPSPTASDMDRENVALAEILDSGDITPLRDRLTNTTGCGVWIPAKPGDQNGPTIADTVNGKA